MKNLQIFTTWIVVATLTLGVAARIRADCCPAPAGLAAFWPGDGNAIDLFGTNNGALAGGATASAAGKVGLSFSFNGTNGSVSIPDSPSLRPTNLTIEAWVNFDSLTSVVSNGAPSGEQYLVFKKNSRGSNFEGYSLEKTAGNQFTFVVSSATGDLRKVTSASLISTGVWYHVTGMRGSNFIQLYVNGSLVGQTNVSSPQDYATNSPLYFGTSGLGYDGKLRGKLDEVTLYNRALSPTEIAAIYSAGAAGKCKTILNDNFVNRTSIFGLTNTVTGSNTNATKETGEPDHAGDNGGHSVWWTWTAPTNATVTVDTSGSSFDTLLAVYTGNSVSNLSEVASNDQLGNNSDSSRLNFNATAGTPYHMTVDGWNGASGNIVLNFQGSLLPKIIQQPTSETVIVANTHTFEVSALSAYPETYQWRKNGTAILSATNVSLELVDVRTSDAGDYSVLVSNLHGATLSSAAVLTVPAAPPNDQFTNRIFFGLLTNSVSGSNIGASYYDPPNSFSYNGRGDVWWAWIAPVSGTVFLNSIGSSFDTDIWVGLGTNQTGVASSGGVRGNEQDLIFDAVAGTEYVFSVGGFSVFEGGSIVLNLRTQFLPPQILEQPQPKLGIAGSFESFIATASGSKPLRFQWQKNSVNIPGATNSYASFFSSEVTSYHNIASIQLADAGTYSVTVSNNLGTATSSNVLLTVLTPVSNDMFANRILVSGNTNITGHNVGTSKENGEPNHAGNSGGHSVWWSWTATANGTVLVDTVGSSFDTLLAVYQGNLLSNLTLVAQSYGATNVANKLAFTAINGAVYQIAVDGLDGESGTMMLNILQPPELFPQIFAQPKSQSVLVGGDAIFSVAAAGMPGSLSYQWFSSGNLILNATSSFLVLTNVQSGWSGNSYHVVVSNAVGVVTSSVAALTVAGHVNVGFKANWPGLWGGAANDVRVVDSLAYIATEAGLMIVDVSDPAHPYLVGKYDTDSPATRILVTNGFAYSLTVSNGVVNGELARLNVQNPVLPRKTAEHVVSATADIAMQGEHLFLADGKTLRILNQDLQTVGVLNVTNELAAVAVSGDLLFLRDRGDDFGVFYGEAGPIHLYSIVTRTNPMFLSDLAQTHSMATRGGFLYRVAQLSSGLETVDLSNPASPKSAADYSSVLHAGANASSAGLEASDGLLFYFLHSKDAPYSYLDIFDISQPRYQSHLMSYLLPKELHPFRFRAHALDSRVYIAASGAGLIILDISDVLNPTEEGRFYTAIAPRQVALQGNFAYVAGADSGFHVLDLANPVTPMRRGGYQTSFPAQTVQVRGRHAYVGVSAVSHDLALEVLDISDPISPRLIKRIAFDEGDTYDSFILRVSALDVFRNIALLARYGEFSSVGRSAFRVFSLTNAANPLLVADYAVGSGEVPALESKSNIVFAAFDGQVHWENGDTYSDLNSVKVFDLANPSTPALIAERLVQNDPTSISIRDNVCYLSGNGWTELFDINQPANPIPLIGASLSNNLALVKDFHAFGSDAVSGVSVFDLSTPLTPVLTGHYPGVQGELEVEGRYVFVAGAEQGLTILDLGVSFATPPGISADPEDARPLPGGTAEFFAGVIGTVPISYQWRLNGINITGAIQPLLVLTNVHTADAGDYSVVVSNSKGTNVSSSATLTVDRSPEITMLSPGENQYFWPGSNILASARAFDPDSTNVWNGFVIKVEFYLNSNLWTTVSNTLPYSNTSYSATLSNVASGNYTFLARALDNEGAWATSAPVAIVVSNLPVFQLSKSNYVVSESDGGVTVTILRSMGGATGTVTFTTQDNQAKAVVPGGVGQYYGVSNMLVFGPYEMSKDILITNVNDLVYRGNKDYRVVLSSAAPANAWQLAGPSTATVTILDDETPGANIFPDVVRPTNTVSAYGSLTVRIEPPAASGRWRLPWDMFWRDSGSSASNLVAGDYPVRFSAIDGYGPLTNVTYTVVGGPNVYTNRLGTNSVGIPGLGSFSIQIFPDPVATATNVSLRGQWRLQGSGSTNWNDSGVVISGQTGQVYVVELKPVAGFETPAPVYARVVPRQQTIYQATYSAPTPGLSVLPNYSTITNNWVPGLPYAYCGQIFSQAGYGSGFVVKRHTVLTAAHMVFDPVTLSYISVDSVWWFFQRHAGEHEPPPQKPRGWYVLDGYASARTTDIIGGDGQSSLTARKRDVAALYFLPTNAPGNGGYGGYLTSDASGHEWLNDPEEKMLVGYPVQNVAETNRGKMHKVGPDFFAFDAASQSETNGLFASANLKGYPGMSGGPVSVRSQTSLGTPHYLAAGVYLGDLVDGRSLVRAIDLDIVNLINSAEDSALVGTDHTGGGVVLVNAAYGASVELPGIVRVSLGPPAAIRAGGAWRVSPTNYGSLYNRTNYTNIARNLLVQDAHFSIEVMALPGFITPTSSPITVAEGAIVPLELMYSVPQPWLTYNRSNGLGFTTTGAVSTVYGIEYAPGLPANGLSNWEILRRITNAPYLGGTNWIWISNTAPTNTTNRLYRARWLSD